MDREFNSGLRCCIKRNVAGEKKLAVQVKNEIPNTGLALFLHSLTWMLKIRRNSPVISKPLTLSAKLLVQLESPCCNAPCPSKPCGIHHTGKKKTQLPGCDLGKTSVLTGEKGAVVSKASPDAFYSARGFHYVSFTLAQAWKGFVILMAVSANSPVLFLSGL